MKATVTLTVIKKLNIDIPEGGSPAECDASAVSQAVRDIEESVLEDPFLFVDSEDAEISVTVEL